MPRPRRYSGISVFAGIGERTREGHELWLEFEGNRGVLARTALVFGQMSEPPGARWRVGLTALTIAEHFRDVKHTRRAVSHRQRLPLCRRRAARFQGSSAGSPRASATSRRSQPRSPSLEERIASVGPAAITSIQAVYVPADDFTDPAVAQTFTHLDSSIVLVAGWQLRGSHPAIDPLASTSILLDPLVIGERHYAIADEARRLIERYRELQEIISLLGIDELGAADRAAVGRARRLIRFLTQPFLVTAEFTGREGRLCSTGQDPRWMPRDPRRDRRHLARGRGLHGRVA